MSSNELTPEEMNEYCLDFKPGTDRDEKVHAFIQEVLDGLGPEAEPLVCIADLTKAAQAVSSTGKSKKITLGRHRYLFRPHHKYPQLTVNSNFMVHFNVYVPIPKKERKKT